MYHLKFIYSFFIEDVFIPAFVELSTTNISENMAKMKAAGVDFPIGKWYIHIKIDNTCFVKNVYIFFYNIYSALFSN